MGIKPGTIEGWGGLTYTGEFIIGRPIVYTEFVISGDAIGYTKGSIGGEGDVI